MVLADVNILVYAHREDAPRHREYLNWVNRVLNSDAAFGVSDLVAERFPESRDPSTCVSRSHTARPRTDIRCLDT